ncbi:MAG: sulfatase [Rhodospirillales bacterium]|jgi:arylsulfatase A-like enzyme|nr:sulfatase [Rhodospirillales bacterium]
MKAVFLLFDSLNRLSLECYGGDTVKTPNFKRLAERTVTFDTHYCGSLPCMPARREIMTGRVNFIHRSWGPVEPFDNAYPEQLAAGAGVYSHLITDHQHYWEDGGATYHTRFDSCELVRGQESDPWKAIVDPDWDKIKSKYHESQNGTKPRTKFVRSMFSRELQNEEADYPTVQCFDEALDFLEVNHDADNWFLHLEVFDPHEPFDAPPGFREAYPTGWTGPILDWPPNGPVNESPEMIEELRANYAAILAHCDKQLGRLLDYFDEHDLWKDTALVVSTDHGFLMGEHDQWAKLVMPCYEEVAHLPLFVHHPEYRSAAGERRKALTQTIDLMPTFLDMFDVDLPKEVEGTSLLKVLEKDETIHDGALYGVFGAAINVTDGRYTYFLYPDDIHCGDLYQYTLMPTHMVTRFSVDELQESSLAAPFDWTKGVPLLKVPSTPKSPQYSRHGSGAQFDCNTKLYDVQADPLQQNPIEDKGVEERLRGLMVDLMIKNDAPPETYRRFGLEDYLPR